MYPQTSDVQVCVDNIRIDAIIYAYHTCVFEMHAYLFTIMQSNPTTQPKLYIMIQDNTRLYNRCLLLFLSPNWG